MSSMFLLVTIVIMCSPDVPCSFCELCPIFPLFLLEFCSKCNSCSCWELCPLHLLFRLGTVPSVFLVSIGNCACAQCVPTVPDGSCTQCVPVPTGNCAQCASCSCWKLCPVCLLFLLGAVPSTQCCTC
jgi:hypothetical protein